MVHTPTLIDQSTRRATQPLPWRMPREVHQDRFLIVGCGNRLYGDAAVGPLVATTVSSWGLSSVESMIVEQLDPDLVFHLSKADYVIFIEPCAETNPAQTTQIHPICIKSPTSEKVHVADNRCDPETLLLLSQQLHNSCPQSWLIKIPTEGFETRQKLSSTAQTGISQALKTVAQFLRTYQQPQR